MENWEHFSVFVSSENKKLITGNLIGRMIFLTSDNYLTPKVQEYLRIVYQLRYI